MCVGGGGGNTNLCKTVTELKVAFRYFFAFSHSEDPKNATDDVPELALSVGAGVRLPTTHH